MHIPNAKVGILISGRGSNMKALIEASEHGVLNAEIVTVIADNTDAKGVEIAAQHGIPIHVLIPKEFSSKKDYEDYVVTLLKAHGAQWVALAGYMRLVGPPILEAFPNQIVNIHPSLLPKYKGLHAQKQALEAGESVIGCTVHFVNAQMDAGEIIMQTQIPVLPGESVEEVSARLLIEENRLYPRALQKVLEASCAH